MDTPPEIILASAIEFLDEGGETDAAGLLRECSLDVYESGDTWFVGDEVHEAVHVEIRARRGVYELLTGGNGPLVTAIRDAIDAALPALTYIKHFTVHARQVDPDDAFSILYNTHSTSDVSATVEDIWLDPPANKDSALTRRILRCELVDNIHSDEARVKLCITHQKRHSRNDPWEDADAFSLATLKAGQSVKLSLNTGETYFLHQALAGLYVVTAAGIPDGPREFTVVDSKSAVVVKGRAAELVRQLTEDATDEFWEAVGRLQPYLFRAVALTKLHEIRETAVKDFERHLKTRDWEENDWQAFFEANTWIFGYGLSYRFLSTITAQPNYGGTTILGTGGQRGDFLTATMAERRFTVLVEIKKPQTSLLEQQLYRNKVHVVGRELTGGVSQLQSNCRTWEIRGSSDPDNQEILIRSGEIYTIQPKGILIIGHSDQLSTGAKRNTFELFRRNLQNPEVIMFDELLERSKHLLLNEQKNMASQAEPPDEL